MKMIWIFNGVKYKIVLTSYGWYIVYRDDYEIAKCVTKIDAFQVISKDSGFDKHLTDDMFSES